MTLTINSGTSFLVANDAGEILPGTEQGLYRDDARSLSEYSLRLDGATPILLSARTPEHNASVHYFTNPELPGAPRRTLTLVRRRTVADDLHEDIDLHNPTGSRLGRYCPSASAGCEYRAYYCRRPSSMWRLAAPDEMCGCTSTPRPEWPTELRAA